MRPMLLFDEMELIALDAKGKDLQGPMASLVLSNVRDQIDATCQRSQPTGQVKRSHLTKLVTGAWNVVPWIGFGGMWSGE